MPTDHEQTELLTSAKDKLDGMTTYIDGKMKRLNLLFAVNGGAFILAKLIFENRNSKIGHLTLTDLATGAIIFTILMTIDTWRWGGRIRKKLFPANDKLVFTWGGKTILFLLAVLIVFAWILAIWD